MRQLKHKKLFAGLFAASIRRRAVLAPLAVVGSFVVAPAGVATAATWSSAGDLDLARVSHQATLLSEGRVLVTGGATTVGNTYDTKAAEIYDPATNAWSSAGTTAYGRHGSDAARLADGKVLVTGGVDANVCTGSTAASSSAELFDPATGTWSATGSMALGRYFATATTLQNGKVLVAGGGNRCGTVFTQAELYDPATGTWSPTGSMNTPREFHDAVLLADGRVLMVGGTDQTFFSSGSAEIYDPSTGAWTATGSMTDDREHPSLTRLADGRVMATGGYTGFGNGKVPTGPAVEIFDPATGTWTATGSLSVGRSSASLSLLSNGMVLAAGGTDGATTHSSAALWDPGTGTWSSTASMAAARSSHSATVLPNGKVLAASGYPGAAPYLPSAELYTPTTYAFNGFLSPVNNEPTLNKVKAGAAVPVKFSLDGDKGLDIFDTGYPRSRSIDCDTSVPIDGIEQTLTAGSSDLSYDAALDQYTYVWKTRKAWKGHCRQLELMLDDGTLHTGSFAFK